MPSFVCAIFVLTTLAVPLPAVVVETRAAATPRELFAAERLRSALEAERQRPQATRIVLNVVPGRFAPGDSQAFRIRRDRDQIRVDASDASGVLYGALELEQRIHAARGLPASIDAEDRPAFVLRGACIGMQKTEITYDGAIYDYRYTPEDFPFFYDRAQWTRYLDMLLENRMNTLYLWNGHPFTSLLKLPKYPDARELANEQLERNIEMFRWLTAEADKRGIWVIQFFYNIHISHALARARGVPFHHSAPSALTSEYTRYAIAEFIRSYPNVGLLMTLGEALAPQNGPEWLARTIIPGVRDGMRAAGMTREPPIIVRAHATDIENAMKQALPLYKNIYTMHKYNGESLTWTDMRGEVERKHTWLAGLGSTHIVNVHLLANLEPFRWGSPDFIQKSLQSCRRHGIQGLHLYPLRYWEWPVTADRAQPPLQQIDRDWIWFAAWARYAWNPDRERAGEIEYWVSRLAEKYGSREAGRLILAAYELSGVCAPRMLPRVGITEGNRQAYSLGMLMTQLIDPARYNENPLTWTGGAPPGERLGEWVEREWTHQPHEGEVPLQVAAEVAASAEKAVRAADAAADKVTREKEEFERLRNDMRAIAMLSRHYRDKAEAAAAVLRYGYSQDLADLDRALSRLEASVAEYRRLVVLTSRTYRQACSVHSASRRIPFLGRPGMYTHWRDCLPAYEQELATFRKRLAALRAGAGRPQRATPAALAGRPVKLIAGDAELFRVQAGEKLYRDGGPQIAAIAPELNGLTGIRVSQQAAVKTGARLQFEVAGPAQILVGFFRSSKKDGAASPPKDEWEPVLRNAVIADRHPGITVYSHALPAGRNDLDFGKGAFVVLGFIPRDTVVEPRIAFFSQAGTGQRADLDWLFE